MSVIVGETFVRDRAVRLLTGLVAAGIAVVAIAGPAAAALPATTPAPAPGGLPAIPPCATCAPGGTQALSVLGGLTFYALLFLFVGFIAGAATWWLGVKAQNYTAASYGRTAVIGSVFGIILVGAGVGILNWGLGLGMAVHG